jgi:type I restriction enzyme S subunit
MSEKNTRLNEFTDGDSDKPDRSQRLENKVDIIKGTKPDEVLDERSDGAEKYLVVDTLTGEDEKYAIDKSAPSAKPRDSIMIMDGSKSGRVYSGDSGILGSTMASLRPDGINPTFLYYFLESNFNRINSATKGSAVPHTDKDLVRSLEYGINSFSEQRKIATVLHTVDQAIQKTEEIINQTKRVKCGLLDDLFLDGYHNHESYENIRIGAFIYSKPAEWEIETIVSSKEGENGLRRGPFGGMLKKEIFVDSGYKVYQQQNVIYDEFDYGDYYITKEKYRDMERFSVEEDDLLISCSGTLGKVAKVPSEYEQGVINQALLKFSVNDDLFNVNYMKYFLESKVGQRQLVLSSRGSAMKNMAPMEFVRSSKVFRPSKKEQNKIAESLSAMDDKISSEKNKKDRLQRLKRALMQDLLSGEVRTTDVNIDVPQEVAQHG